MIKKIVFLLIFCSSFLAAKNVIVFSGTTTAGKTSICRELVKLLPRAADVHFDDYFGDIVAQSRQESEQSADWWHSVACKTSDRVRQRVTELTCRENVETIVCDAFVMDECDMQKYRDAAPGCDVYFVLIYCPLDVLLKRVQERNERAEKNNTPEEFRCIDSVYWEFANTYCSSVCCPPAGGFNPRVAGARLLSKKTVCDLAPKNFDCAQREVLFGGVPLETYVLQKLGLDNHDPVLLMPRLPFDCVVNNDEWATPHSCAREIKTFLVDQKQEAAAIRCHCNSCFYPVSKFFRRIL